MCRKDLLKDVAAVIEGCGFEYSPFAQTFTYQRDVAYPSLIPDKTDRAHFLLNTAAGKIQIVVKYQKVKGTAIEKLAYTALDAARTEHNRFIVVCGGVELEGKALQFLNELKHTAPKLEAIKVHDLEDVLLAAVA